MIQGRARDEEVIIIWCMEDDGDGDGRKRNRVVNDRCAYQLIN